MRRNRPWWTPTICAIVGISVTIGSWQLSDQSLFWECWLFPYLPWCRAVPDPPVPQPKPDPGPMCPNEGCY